MSRIVGIVLTAVGILMFVWGLDASDSFSSEMSRIFRGTPTDRTLWLLVGGALTGVTGLSLLFGPRFGKGKNDS